MLGPIQAHLPFTQINSIRFPFIGTIELITCLEILKFEVLKIGSLKFLKLRILK